MKKIVLYCDRPCVPEDHRATRVVWIRTAGLGRSVRQDVCEHAFAIILGTSANGATAPSSPPERPRLKGELFRPGSGAAKTADKIRAYLGKHSPASIEQIARSLAGSGKPDATGAARVLQVLARTNEVTRVAMGVYAGAGAPALTPPSEEIAAARAVLRLVDGEPGIRSAYIGPLLGYRDNQPLKRLFAKRVEGGRLKSKGHKSATRYFPGTAKS
jgi:hypothetical protein